MYTRSIHISFIYFSYNFSILLDITKNAERREIPINETLKDTLKRITRRLDIRHVFFDPKTGKAYGDIK